MNTLHNTSASPGGPGSWTFWERLGGVLVFLLAMELLLWPEVVAPRFGRIFAELLGAGHPLPMVTNMVVQTGFPAWLALFPLGILGYTWRRDLSRSGRQAALGGALVAGLVAFLFCGFAVLMPLSQLVLSLPQR